MKSLLTMTYMTMLDDKGIGMQDVLSIVVHGRWQWACDLAAWILTYDFPPEVLETGVMTARVVTTCQPY